MKKKFSQRLKITKTGKVIRRKMGQAHSLSKMNRNQKSRRRTETNLVLAKKVLTKLH